VTIHTGPGNDTVRVATAASPLTVYGDAGDDVLVGNGHGATLDGGAGRDLLIAGAAPATLLGGGDEDILVGGTTAYDLNPGALAAIMAEWTQADVPYAQRVDHLLHGGGLNGATRLDVAAFTSNGAGNTLTGADGLDLFYGSKARDTHDWDRRIGEVFIDPDAVQHETLIDATGLFGPYVFLDYVAYDPSTPLDVDLAAGEHVFYTYGGSSISFTVNDDGTLAYDPALEGTLSGWGTNALTVHGQAVRIDSAGLFGNYVFLDYATYSDDDATTPDHVNLLPGDHILYTYGGNSVTFTVTADATVDYDAALDGVLTGRGTGTLAVQGQRVQIDSAGLFGNYVFLDYATYSADDAAAPGSANLLPGDHILSTYGGSSVSFTVNADGTVDYDAALDGVLSGRGTGALAVQGLEVTIDASALSEASLALDYAGADATAPQAVRLLPGEHQIYTAARGEVGFTVLADGTLDYDAALDGILSGRGTRTLTFLPA
jgi:hypothetical protein